MYRSEILPYQQKTLRNKLKEWIEDEIKNSVIRNDNHKKNLRFRKKEELRKDFAEWLDKNDIKRDREEYLLGKFQECCDDGSQFSANKTFHTLLFYFLLHRKVLILSEYESQKSIQYSVYDIIYKKSIPFFAHLKDYIKATSYASLVSVDEKSSILAWCKKIEPVYALGDATYNGTKLNDLASLRGFETIYYFEFSVAATDRGDDIALLGIICNVEFDHVIPNQISIDLILEPNNLNQSDGKFTTAKLTINNGVIEDLSFENTNGTKYEFKLSEEISRFPLQDSKNTYSEVMVDKSNIDSVVSTLENSIESLKKLRSTIDVDNDKFRENLKRIQIELGASLKAAVDSIVEESKPSHVDYMEREPQNADEGLWMSARDGDLVGVRRYLSDGGDVNYVAPYINVEYTALHIAFERRNFDVAKAILLNGNFNLSTRDRFGRIATADLHCSNEFNKFLRSMGFEQFHHFENLVAFTDSAIWAPAALEDIDNREAYQPSGEDFWIIKPPTTLQKIGRIFDRKSY